MLGWLSLTFYNKTETYLGKLYNLNKLQRQHTVKKRFEMPLALYVSGKNIFWSTHTWGPFTIYVYKWRWVGGLKNVNDCKRGVGRWLGHCKRLQKYFTHKMILNFRAKLHIRGPTFCVTNKCFF